MVPAQSPFLSVGLRSGPLTNIILARIQTSSRASHAAHIKVSGCDSAAVAGHNSHSQ